MWKTQVPLGQGRARTDKEAVAIHDRESGVRWVVVPERVDGRPALIYVSEESRHGEVLSRVSRIDRDVLAILALRHMEKTAEDDAQGFISSARPADIHTRSTPPDDAALLRVIRDAIAADKSVRQTVAHVFGVSVNTADKWYRYARGRPGASDLPTPRRGRPAGRKNLKTKDQS